MIVHCVTLVVVVFGTVQSQSTFAIRGASDLQLHVEEAVLIVGWMAIMICSEICGLACWPVHEHVGALTKVLVIIQKA